RTTGAHCQRHATRRHPQAPISAEGAHPFHGTTRARGCSCVCNGSAPIGGVAMAVKRIRRSPCRDFLGVKCAVSAPPPNPLSRLAHTEGALAGRFQDRGGPKHKSAPWLRNGLCEGTSGHALSRPVLAA
ncbi:uncharacterized protein Tco025E_09415, partial [Trypanosoma conorhini]